MHDCIFTGFCVNGECDKACPDYVESTYLLEKNNISLKSNVFHADPKLLQKYHTIVKSSEDKKLITVVANNTNEAAELLTYCGICKHWKHSRLHMVVYNLRFSQYLDNIQKSWNTKGMSDNTEYTKIWSESAKLLIISNIDYVNFKEFQCQTLLSLIQNRDANGLSTIIVSPQITSLAGDGLFFGQLKNMMTHSIQK